MALPTVTLDGRTTADPELRFTPAGKAVCGINVVASERYKDDTGAWQDGDRSPFLRVTLWGQQAEDAAEHIVKGERVLVTGKLFERTYQRNDGTEGRSVELKHATVARVPNGRPRTDRQQGGQPQQQADPWAQPQRPQQQADPWAQQAGYTDPPF